MPTLNASTGIAQGSVTAVESISLATFWGRLSTRGIDISFIDFFYASGANIYRRRLPHAFLSALDHEFERFGVFEYSF
jgi:hypothetical protein